MRTVPTDIENPDTRHNEIRVLVRHSSPTRSGAGNSRSDWDRPDCADRIAWLGLVVRELRAELGVAEMAGNINFVHAGQAFHVIMSVYIW